MFNGRMSRKAVTESFSNIILDGACLAAILQNMHESSNAKLKSASAISLYALAIHISFT